MKKTIITLTVIISLAIASLAFASSFCDGFKRGYIIGYQKITGYKPLPPLCPLQPLKGFNDPQSDFEHGYVIGLQHGMADGMKQ